MPEEIRNIPRKIKQLVVLILISEATYFTYYVLLQLRSIGLKVAAVTNVIEAEILGLYVQNLTDRLIVFAPPFNGTLWHVGSLIAVYCCIWWLGNRYSSRTALVISCFLLVIGFVTRRVLAHWDINTTIPYERILPFLPFPFFEIGYHIRKYEIQINYVDDLFFFLIFLIGFISTLLECQFGVHTLYFGTILLVVSATAYCGKHKHYGSTNLFVMYLSHIGKTTSKYIYLFHMLIGYVLSVIVPRILNLQPESIFLTWGMPIIICLTTVVFSEILYQIFQSIKKR